MLREKQRQTENGKIAFRIEQAYLSLSAVHDPD